MKRKKLVVLAGLLFGLAAVVLLAMSISQVQFEEGTIVRFEQEGESQLSPRGAPNEQGELDPTTRTILTIFLMIIIPISIIYVILNPRAWRQILRNVATIGLVFLLIFIFTAIFNPSGDRQGGTPEGGFGASRGLDSEVRDLSELQVDPPSWLGFIVGFVVLALILGIALFIATKKKYQPEPEEIESIVNDAEGALQDLRSGADLRLTIIRCYQQMCDTLSDERGVHRVRAMTPREFERYLASAGLGDEHIKRLTRLFESVRYGDEASQPQMEREAESCLQAIVTTYARSST